MKRFFAYIALFLLLGCESLGLKDKYCFDCTVNYYTDKGQLANSSKGEYCNKDYDELSKTQGQKTTATFNGISVTVTKSLDCTKK